MPQQWQQQRQYTPQAVVQQQKPLGSRLGSCECSNAGEPHPPLPPQRHRQEPHSSDPRQSPALCRPCGGAALPVTCPGQLQGRAQAVTTPRRSSRSSRCHRGRGRRCPSCAVTCAGPLHPCCCAGGRGTHDGVCEASRYQAGEEGASKQHVCTSKLQAVAVLCLSKGVLKGAHRYATAAVPCVCVQSRQSKGARQGSCSSTNRTRQAAAPFVSFPLAPGELPDGAGTCAVKETLEQV